MASAPILRTEDVSGSGNPACVMACGVLFFGLFALSGVAAVLTLVALVATLLGRRGLGISVLLWFWGALLALWALCWPLMRWTTRMERNPARREAEREFPSVVIQMRRIS